MSIASGRRLGPYEVVSSLGAGGMGEVYRARDTRLGRDVALKVLPADRASDPDRRRRFEQEARAVAALEHPHILALHDLGSENGLSYVVFELVEGQTLREKLEQGALPVRKAVEWGVQICRGLAAAHARGIVHRDLKPENVSITTDGRVKILDFGLAKLTAPVGPDDLPEAETRTATDAGIVVGTVGYMSPEQVRGQAVDARTDIFAVGAILYEMLTGRRAFQGATPADTLSAILHHDPPEMTSGSGPVPGGLDRVIRRCLEKDPDERFQNARDLAFALEHHSGVSSSSAAPVGPRSTRRLWAKVAAAVLAASGLAGAAFVLGARQSTRVPEFQQLTFRLGSIFAARFTPDGNSVVYSAFFDGNPIETYSMRLDQQEPLRLDLPSAGLMGLSPSGEMALRLGQPGERRNWWRGTLARAPLSGGSTRQIMDDVVYADWAPNGQDLAVIRKVGREGQLEYPVGNVLRRPLRGGAGLGMRVSPRGDKVAFTCWDGTSSVTVFDRSGGTLVLKTEPLPGGLAWDPSGDAVWTLAGTGLQGTGLWRLGLDGSTRLVARLAGPGAMLHDVARDGRFLISLGVGGGGLRAKPPDETAEREVCPFGGCLEFDLSNDGRQVLLRDVSKSAGALGHVDWIFLQPTNGGPPVRLGRGYPEALSPDGRWALATGEHGLELMPTGAGTTRTVNVGGLKDVGNPQDVGNPWFPDADHVLIMGKGEDGSLRTHLLDLAGGKPKPVTPDDVSVPPGPVLRGSVLGIHRQDKSMAWYPLAGGDPRPLTVRQPVDSRALRVSADGQGLLFEEYAMPGQVDRLDLTTGRRTTWKTLLMEDRVGVDGGPRTPRITPDGRAYAYGYLRFWGNLYLVDGVR